MSWNTGGSKYPLINPELAPGIIAKYMESDEVVRFGAAEAFIVGGGSKLMKDHDMPPAAMNRLALTWSRHGKDLGKLHEQGRTNADIFIEGITGYTHVGNGLVFVKDGLIHEHKSSQEISIDALLAKAQDKDAIANLSDVERQQLTVLRGVIDAALGDS